MFAQQKKTEKCRPVGPVLSCLVYVILLFTRPFFSSSRGTSQQQTRRMTGARDELRVVYNQPQIHTRTARAAFLFTRGDRRVCSVVFFGKVSKQFAALPDGSFFWPSSWEEIQLGFDVMDFVHIAHNAVGQPLVWMEGRPAGDSSATLLRATAAMATTEASRQLGTITETKNTRDAWKSHKIPHRKKTARKASAYRAP